MDDIALTIVRDIILRVIEGDVRVDGAELVTLDVIARDRQTPFGTKCFARGALAWLDRQTHEQVGL